MTFFGKTVIIEPNAPNAPRRLRIGLLAALALVALAISRAGAASPAAAASPANPLGESARRLAEIDSLDARLRLRADLFGERVAGSGRYLQKRNARGPLLLQLDFRFELGSVQIRQIQQCDGRFLWIRREGLGEPALFQVDLQRIQEAMRAARRNPLSDPSTNWLLLGGLPRLLQNLDEHFDFAEPRPAKVDSSPVWVLEGHWKPESLAERLPDQAEAIRRGGAVDLAKLPPRIPTHVEVVLDQQNLLPYRIDYRRGEQAAASPGKLTGGRSIVLMELIEIRRRDDLRDSYFRFDPDQQTPVDRTASYLQSLGLAPSPDPPPAD